MKRVCQSAKQSAQSCRKNAFQDCRVVESRVSKDLHVLRRKPRRSPGQLACEFQQRNFFFGDSSKRPAIECLAIIVTASTRYRTQKALLLGPTQDVFTHHYRIDESFLGLDSPWQFALRTEQVGKQSVRRNKSGVLAGWLVSDCQRLAHKTSGESVYREPGVCLLHPALWPNHTITATYAPPSPMFLGRGWSFCDSVM